MSYPFKRTKQKLFKKRIFGFDIETHNDNKDFTLASIVGYDRYGTTYEKTFYSQDELIHEIKTNVIFRNSVIFATNLHFDFFGTFFKKEDEGKFKTCMRGSHLLSAKTYFDGDNFTNNYKQKYKSNKQKASLEFLDSKNYATLSVANMGKVIGLEKLPSPNFVDYPETKEDMDYMIKYNFRDSWITYKFMEFFINAVEELGATFKMTMASTAMSLFRNKYLGDRIIFQSSKDILRKEFVAYYGGRTETFKRGHFTNANYYDFNSLYPSQMHEQLFPDPNTQRISYANKLDYILRYEGTSEVTIEIPNLSAQPLPYRFENKLVFGYGTFKARWSHPELRQALADGCTIIKVHETIYYLENCTPFKRFIEALYTLRLKYKVEKNPMEVVVKLLMNSLYGKFGEKFDDKNTYVHKDMATKEQLLSAKSINDSGEYFSLGEDREPKNHCIPIWAIYVAAYGRLKMYNLLKAHPNTIYCDTDSAITPDIIPTSTALGDLKLETKIIEGYTVRPKFYIYEDEKGVKHTVLKGLGRKAEYDEVLSLTNETVLSYNSFTKIRTANRKGILPNQIVEVNKTFSLEDTKRDWRGKTFDFNDFQDSDPLHIENDEVIPPEPEQIPIMDQNFQPVLSCLVEM